MKWTAWLFFLVCILALGRFQESSHYNIAKIALINGAANMWSLFVLFKYRRNQNMVPPLYVLMNAVSSIIGVLLLVLSFLL